MIRNRFASALVIAAFLGGCCLPLPFGEEEESSAAAPETPAAAAAPTEPSAAGAADAPSEPAQPEVSQTELQARKIAEYTTNCMNRFSERAFSARGRYLQWVDEEEGPTGHERHIYGVYTLNGNARNCREAVTRAASMPPSMPEAERAADAYASAIEQLQPLLARADRYYERESYRDDDMAQGREMHGPLMEAFDAFTTADEDLRRQVDQVQDRARAERIERMAGDPSMRSRYLVERTIAQSLAAMRMARELRIENHRYVSDDPEAFIQAVQTLQTGVDELTAHQPSGTDQAPSGFGSFKGEAESYLESALGCMRRVRDEERFSTGERMNLGGSGEWMVDGSVGQMQNRYNEMVDAYNRLR